MLFCDNEYLCSVPDLISIVDSKSRMPVSNSSLQKGREVMVFGTPALPIWLTTEAIALLGPVQFGFNHECRQVQTTNDSWCYQLMGCREVALRKKTITDKSNTNKTNLLTINDVRVRKNPKQQWLPQCSQHTFLLLTKTKNPKCHSVKCITDLFGHREKTCKKQIHASTFSRNTTGKMAKKRGEAWSSPRITRFFRRG